MNEFQYYDIVRNWLEEQGYYCGGNIEIKGKRNYYQNIGPRYRRADVAGVRNTGNPFEDQIEIVAVEVRDRTRISDQDIRDTVNYRRYAHKCYLATTAPITDKFKRIAEQTNIGLLQLEKGKNEPILLHSPTPKNPENYTEMMAFLESFEIVKCSVCGCFFERFVRRSEDYSSFFEMVRATYFRAMKQTEHNPLDLKEIKDLPSEYKIYRYICHPCFEELFLNRKRIQRIQSALTKMKEWHARWNKDEEGFSCLVGKKKACTDYIYDPIEIVEHLQGKHKIPPDDQIIKGWTGKHQRAWERHISKKG